MTITINVLGDEIECRDFHDIVGTSTEVTGVEIYRDGERLGSMVGYSVPDKNDADAMYDFEEEVEEWLIENEY